MKVLLLFVVLVTMLLGSMCSQEWPITAAPRRERQKALKFDTLSLCRGGHYVGGHHVGETLCRGRELTRSAQGPGL